MTGTPPSDHGGVRCCPHGETTLCQHGRCDECVLGSVRVEVNGVPVLGRVERRANRGKCERGHDDCFGPLVPANEGGCRMATWSDVG